MKTYKQKLVSTTQLAADVEMLVRIMGRMPGLFIYNQVDDTNPTPLSDEPYGQLAKIIKKIGYLNIQVHLIPKK